MKIVAIAGSVYPNESATGAICKRIVQNFSEEDSVSIISMQNDRSNFGQSTVRGIRHYILTTKLFRFKHYLKSRNSKFLYNFVRIIYKLKELLFCPKSTWWFVSKASKLLLAIDSTEGIDVILSFSEPFESHFAVKKYRKMGGKAKWIALSMDSYATSNFKKNLFVSLRQMEEMEVEVMNCADVVFITPEIKENRKKFLEKVVTPVEIYPYVINFERESIKSKNKNKIVFVYAGRFYKKIRRPEPILELIDAVNNDNFEWIFYTEGECENIITAYVRKNRNVRLHKMVDKEDLFEIYEDADFLINMSNSTTLFTPSKQYEYIGRCKPIISLYYSLEDSELENYGYALQIRCDEIQNRKEDFNKFVLENKDRIIKSENIEKRFYNHTNDYVMKKIKGYLGQ